MANEPSWDELFNAQPARPDATRPYSIDPEPAVPAAAPAPADDDPFAALFGSLNTGQTPEATPAPAATPAQPLVQQQPVPPEFASQQPAYQQTGPVQQLTPQAWPIGTPNAVDAESAPADPFSGLFANPQAPAPLVEPPAPQVSNDPFGAVFAAPPAVAPAAAPAVAPTPAVTTGGAPLTRRELREREALGAAVPVAPAAAVPTAAYPAAAAPTAAFPVAAVPAAAAANDIFAALSTSASVPAGTPAAPTEDVFPFDFGGGSGRGGSGGDGSRPDQPKKRRSLLWLKITLPIVIVLGLVGGAAAFVWLNYEEQVRQVLGWELPNDYEGTGNGEEVIVTIQSGDLGSDIANTLKDAGVTMTFDAFYDLLLAQPENVNFLPGNYSLQKEMSAQSALDALLDPANKVTSKLLITEGTTLPSALEIIAETTGIPIADVQAAAADPTVYGVPAGEPSLEGWLFPATYELDGSETATDILQLLVDTMVQHLDDAGVAPEDRHRVLTLASIIQREAGSNQDDFYKIARVFQNRLDQGINLQSDATVAYGTGNLHTVWTTDDERADASNLYNTYANAGLPIGPIGLPGDLAIDAALHPADGPWLFFVPINLATGETVFSETAEEHEAAVDQLHAWCDESEENASYCE